MLSVSLVMSLCVLLDPSLTPISLEPPVVIQIIQVQVRIKMEKARKENRIRMEKAEAAAEAAEKMQRQGTPALLEEKEEKARRAPPLAAPKAAKRVIPPLAEVLGNR